MATERIYQAVLDVAARRQGGGRFQARLDIGAGRGELIKLLRDCFQTRSSAYGCDSAVQRARDFAGFNHSEDCQPSCGPRFRLLGQAGFFPHTVFAPPTLRRPGWRLLEQRSETPIE